MSSTILRTVLIVLTAATVVVAAEFHVASNGNDANPGTTAKPFATLERARNAVRELKKAGPLKEPVTVWLAGGVYALKGAVTFGPEDSGTASCPITYVSAAAEPAVLDCGRRLTGWQKHNEKLWVASVPEVAAGCCKEVELSPF